MSLAKAAGRLAPGGFSIMGGKYAVLLSQFHDHQTFLSSMSAPVQPLLVPLSAFGYFGEQRYSHSMALVRRLRLGRAQLARVQLTKGNLGITTANTARKLTVNDVKS